MAKADPAGMSWLSKFIKSVENIFTNSLKISIAPLMGNFKQVLNNVDGCDAHQEVLGVICSEALNTFGQVKSVSCYKGDTQVDTTVLTGSNAITLGGISMFPRGTTTYDIYT